MEDRQTMPVSDERLADIAAEYGSMADGLPPQLEDGPGAASAFYMSCALDEIAAMATELQSLRAAAKVRAIREGDGEWSSLAAKLKDYDDAVRWHSYRPHDVNRETAQHKAAAKLADAVRAMIAASPIPATGGESSSESHGTHDLNAPTDNLEAGAGDLVERLNGLLADYDADLKATIAAGILPDRTAYGEDVSGVTYATIREAASQLAAVTAENARLRERIKQAYKAGFDFAMLTNSADADLAAENARLREAIADLNVTDQELVRIHNMCTGFDGDVKIWAKMLHKLAVFALAARTALSQEAPK